VTVPFFNLPIFRTKGSPLILFHRRRRRLGQVILGAANLQNVVRILDQ
jgi:hypothetical protein